MKLKSLVAVALGAVAFTSTAATPHPVGSKVIANGFEYTVAGENLITNGDFSDGFNGWSDGAWNTPTSSNFSIVSNGPTGDAYIRANGHEGANSAKSLRRNVQLEAGKTYVLSFVYKTNPGQDINCAVIGLVNGAQTDADQNVISYVPKSTLWTTASYVFTATETNNFASMKFCWLRNQSNYDGFCATDFFLAEATPTTTLTGSQMLVDDSRYNVLSENLIENGDFSNGFAGWKTGDNKTDLSTKGWELLDGGPHGNGAYIKVKPGTEGNNSRGSSTSFSLMKVVKLDPAKTYVLSFWDKAVDAGDNARVTQSNKESSNDNHRLYTCSKANNWGMHAIVVRPTEAEPYLVINLAWMTAGASFTDFKLVEVEDAYNGNAYRIKQANTGLYWACAKQGNVNQVLVAEPDQEGYEYTFLFDQAAINAFRPSAFNLTCADGRTVRRCTDSEGKWNVWYTDYNRNDERAMFNVREIGGRLFMFNHSSNNILATDGTTSNSAIYNDKGYNKVANGKFTAVIELEPAEYAFTNRWIKEEAAPAEQLYNDRLQHSENIGTHLANLRNILDEAYDVTGCTSVDDIRAKVQAVKDAANEFDTNTLGVTDINSDTNAPVQYFDINGRPVAAEDLTSGVYILRQGSKVAKVVR